MRKFLKITAWILGGTVALSLAAFLALKLYFTPTRIKSLIVVYTAETLKRETSLDSATLTFNGFTVKNLRISEYPDFKRGEFVSIAEFDIHPDLRALLRRQLKVNSITATGVDLNVIEVSTGTYNFSDILRSSQTTEQSGNSGVSGAAAFSISNITLKNSSLSYLSADKTLAVKLSGMKFTAASISGDNLFPFEAESGVNVKSPYLTGDFPVTMKGKLSLGGLDLDKGKAVIEAGTLKVGDIDAGYTGTLEGFLKSSVKLKLNVKPFSTSDLKPYIPAVPLRIPIPAAEINSEFNSTTSSAVFKHISFKVGPAEGSTEGSVKWNPTFDYDMVANVKVHTPKLQSDVLSANFPAIPKGFTIPPANMDAEISLTPNKVNIRRAEITAASLKASLVGDMTQTPLSFAGIAEAAIGEMKDFSTIVPLLKPYEPKGKAGARLKIGYGKKLMLSGKVIFNGMGAKFSSCELSSLKGSINISKTQVKSKGISAKLNGADLKLDFTASNYLEHPKIALNLEQAPVTIAELPAMAGEQSSGTAKAAQPAPQGKPFSFDLRGASKIAGITYPELNTKESEFKYDLKGISADLKGLSGKASFEVKGGKLDNLCALAEKNKVSKVALYPMVILAVASRTIKGVKLPDFNTIIFSKMEGDYLFENGIMKLQKSTLDAEQADVNASGSINLVTEEIDMKVSIKLKKASGISMSVPLVMKIKGTFTAPEAKVDMKSVMDQPVIKDNLKKLLDGLLKKKK